LRINCASLAHRWHIAGASLVHHGRIAGTSLAHRLHLEMHPEQTKFIGTEKSGSSEKSVDAPMSTDVTSSDAVEKSYAQLLATMGKGGSNHS
jgi:hypothetical protein